MTKLTFVVKIHLVISVFIVVPVALIYGFKPTVLCDISLKTTDMLNVFKALMVLYLGFAGLWGFGLFYKAYLKIALVSNIVFMLALGLGRLLSFVLDGKPSLVFVLGAFGELLLGCYGLWVCMYFKEQLSDNNAAES
jgi:hypothetical protein